MARNTKVCSFCGRSVTETKSLFYGPGVAICNYCVDNCNNMMINQGIEAQEEQSKDFLTEIPTP